MQARAFETSFDIGLSEAKKEGLVESCNEVHFGHMENVVSDQVLVLL